MVTVQAIHMSLSPSDIEQIRRIIAAEVATAVAIAVQPLREDVDVLRKVDRRHDARLASHSGAHKDIIADVKRTTGELAVSTQEQLVAVQTTMAQSLDEIRREMKSGALSSAPAAARAAETAATAAKDATTDLAIAHATREGKSKREARLRTFGLFIALVISTVINHLSK